MKSRIWPYLMVAASLVAVIFCSALLRGITDARIQGASPNKRYFAVGLQTAHGVDYQLSTNLMRQLGQHLPAGIAITTSAILPVNFVLPDGTTRQDHVVTAMVSAHYFRAMAPPRMLGATITAAEVRAHAPVVVINDALAKTLFGGARAALGRDLLASRHDGHVIPVEIVGVVTNSFYGIYSVTVRRRGEPYAWMPISAFFQILGERQPPDIRGVPVLLSAPTRMSLREVRHDVTVAWRRLPGSVVPQGASGIVVTQPFALDPHDVAVVASRLRLYFWVAIVVLLLTSANLLATGFLKALRQRHMRAIERTLGATRAWQLRDSLLRALPGTLLTNIVADALLATALIFTRHALAAVGHFSVWRPVVRDLNVLRMMFAALLVSLAITAVDVVVYVVLSAQDFGAFDVSRTGTPRSERVLGGGTLVIEFTLAAILSVLAFWGMQYAWRMANVNLGMLQGRPVTLLSMEYKHVRTGNISVSRAALMADLRRAIVASDPHAWVGFGPVVGFAYRHGGGNFRAGRPVELTAEGAGIAAQGFVASTGWMRAGELQLLAGRNFSSGNPDPRDVLIDARVAHVLFGSAHAAVGRVLYRRSGRKSYSYRVRGVIAPLHMRGPGRRAITCYLMPVTSHLHGFSAGFELWGGHILIRPEIPVARYAALKAIVQRVFARDAPYLQVGSIESSTKVLTRLEHPQRVLAAIFGAVAGFGLLVALTGLVVFLRLFLAMRKRADAIRQALGASPRRQYRGVLLGTLALGVGGAVPALLFTPWLAQQFALLSRAQVSPFGWPTWVALAVLLLAVALVAHFPARRAARAEPVESLHEL